MKSATGLELDIIVASSKSSSPAMQALPRLHQAVESCMRMVWLSCCSECRECPSTDRPGFLLSGCSRLPFEQTPGAADLAYLSEIGTACVLWWLVLAARYAHLLLDALDPGLALVAHFDLLSPWTSHTQ